MTRLSTLWLLGSALSFISSAHAGTTTPQIVVTATRSPADMSQIASSMTVISAEEIEQKNKSTVVELLRQVPGLNVIGSGGTGQNARVFMRGTNSNHVLVMMDGVALNDPSDTANAYDFSNLTTDNIERIEILCGPQSTIYGSQAIGGVINIISKKGAGKPGYSAFGEYGRYGSHKEGVGASGEAGRTSYSFTASNSHTDGISAFSKVYGGREKDENGTYAFSGNVASRLSDNFTAKFTGRYNRSVTDFDSVGSIPNFGLRPDDDLYPNADNRQFNLRAAGELSLLEGRWTQELGVSTLNFNRDLITEYFDASFNPLFGRRQYTGHRDVIDWVHRIRHFEHHLITAGIELGSEHFKTLDLAEQDVDNQAFFVNDQFTIGEGFFANIGTRIDDHQAFGRQFTWKAAPGYRIDSTGTTFKASYGTGFKAPSLSQLYDPTSGNSALGPEKSRGWEAGFEQSLWGDKVTLSATGFKNTITDLVGFGPSPLFLTLNVGKARTEGVESGITLRPTAAVTLTASHTFTLAENRVADTQLLRRPRHLANFEALYQYSERGDIGMHARYASKSRDFYYASSTGEIRDVKAFSAIDLSANYALTPNTTLYGRLENILDRRYEELSGYGQPGRGLYVGAKTNF